MGLFSSDEIDKATCENTSDDQEYEEKEIEIVEVEEEHEFEYTVHKGVIRYRDGETERIEFDEMSVGDGRYVFSEYVSISDRVCSPAEVRGSKDYNSQKICTFERDAVAKIETVERKKDSLTMTETVTVPADDFDEEEDERKVVDRRTETQNVHVMIM